MTQVSRPLIALLIASVVFFAVWMVALKPKSDSGSSTQSAPLQSAVDKAHAAVAQSNAASAAHGGTPSPTPATASTPSTASASAGATSHPTASPATTSTTAPATTTNATASAPAKTDAAVAEATAAANRQAAARAAVARTAAQRQAVVTHALRAHKVVALLFYNYRAADDRAVKRELATIPTHGGQVVKLAIPIRELAQYKVVTQQVAVTGSPTLIIIDRTHYAWTVVGFAGRFEIAQRVSDALAVKATP